MTLEEIEKALVGRLLNYSIDCGDWVIKSVYCDKEPRKGTFYIVEVYGFQDNKVAETHYSETEIRKLIFSGKTSDGKVWIKA